MSYRRSLIYWSGREHCLAISAGLRPFLAFVLFILCVLHPAAAADEITVFGPEKFVRGFTIPRETSVRLFTLSEPVVACRLLVENGPRGWKRSKLAWIRLNGKTVLKPGDFSKSVGQIEKTVSLRAENRLEISLKSLPRSYLIVSVRCTKPPSANQNPQIISSPVITARAREPYSYQVQAIDPDPGDLLQFAVNGPAGMVIDAASGLLQWPSPVAGTYLITVTVTDGKGGAASQVYSLNVSPLLVAVPDLVGLLLADAELTLQSAGLATGVVTEKPVLATPSERVLGQVPPAGGHVAEGGAVDLIVAAIPPGRPEELIDASWEGLWQMRLVNRDLATDKTDSVEEVTDAICADDPVGLGLIEAVGADRAEAEQTVCEGSATAEWIDATCTSLVTIAEICTLSVSTQLSLALDGDRILGVSSWSATDPCGIPLLSQGQTTLISGTRLSVETGAACAAPPSSLLQKFLRNPLSVYLQEGP